MEMEKEDIQAIEAAIQFIHEHWDNMEGRQIIKRLEAVSRKYTPMGYMTQAAKYAETVGRAGQKYVEGLKRAETRKEAQAYAASVGKAGEKYQAAMEKEGHYVKKVGLLRTIYGGARYKAEIWRASDSTDPKRRIYIWELTDNSKMQIIASGTAPTPDDAEGEIKLAMRKA